MISGNPHQHILKFPEDHQLPADISGRSTALCAKPKYPESQQPAYRNIKNVNNDIPRFLEFLNISFRDHKLPTEASEISSATY